MSCCAPRRPPQLGEDDLHVWRLATASAITKSEIATVLSRYLRVDPRAIHLRRDDDGKPELAGVHRGHLGFNVSHGGRFGLLAIGRARKVGVDVEPLRSPPTGWALADEALTIRERQALSLAGEEESSAFLRIWVRKEALLKAAGVGLSVEPRLVELRGTRVLSLPPALGEPAAWALSDLSLPGHAGAVAVEGPEPRVRLFA